MQDAQAEAETEGIKEPAGQVAQTVETTAPVAAEKKPLGQTMQSEAPEDAWTQGGDITEG